MEVLLIILYIYAFIVGTCVASFMNVVIYRVPKQISVAKGRSFCPSCHHTLNGFDMIPIFGWFLVKGKCRYCKEPISVRYPIIEGIGGILGLLCYFQYENHWMTLISFALSMVLLAITMIDFDTMTIPNGLVIAVFVIGIFSFIAMPEITFVSRMIGMLCISVPMFLLTVIIPDSFGGGDIKLVFAAGFLLGWQNMLLAFFIAILIAGGYASYLLLSKKSKKGAHIAFGPYLCIGIFISLLQGSALLAWYISLFHV